MDELFNASEYLLDRRVEEGNGSRLALTGIEGDLTYRELHERVCHAAVGLQEAGLHPEQRIVLFMADSPDFVVLYLAAMRMGAVPVPLSTMLHADAVASHLRDSRARLIGVTAEFAQVAERALCGAPELAAVVLGRGASMETRLPTHSLSDWSSADADGPVYSTGPDSPAFWLYTSGTTGTPKGAMHRHGSIRATCETYGRQVLGVRPEDRCLSAAKAFFAYGLGNSVLFPMSVGATTILEPAPSAPHLLVDRAQKYGCTLFFAGPTFFANMLKAELPPDALRGTRLAASAGEALPAALYERWSTRFGVDILDGIGMTEMLHIFLSNREGAVKPGTTGIAVPGYDLKVVDETGVEVAPGIPGTLMVRGPSTATGYWCRYDASRQVFQGEWLRTGDTYVQDSDGCYRNLGRTGDMLKVSGIWVSPSELEARLLAHEAVASAVVVGALDTDGLEKPVAFVILAGGQEVTEDELVAFCREGLPSFERPRRVEFVDQYPTTATGKVRRVELREHAAALLAGAGTQSDAAPPAAD